MTFQAQLVSQAATKLLLSGPDKSMHVLEIHRPLAVLLFDLPARQFGIARDKGSNQVRRDTLHVHRSAAQGGPAGVAAPPV